MFGNDKVRAMNFAAGVIEDAAFCQLMRVQILSNPLELGAR